MPSGEAKGGDNRRAARDSITLFVEYDGADDLVGDYTENLSTGGTFVATNRALPVGTQVQLVLSFPGLLQPIAIDGTVRWTRGASGSGDDSDGAGPGAGIEFVAGASCDALAAMVDRIRSRDPSTIARLFRVLIVEDNRHIAELIQHGLVGAARRDFGAGVSFAFRDAGDGGSAIEILRSEPFDLAIMDFYLPIVDGAAVIAIAREQLGLRALPIIAMSAAGEAARDAALAAGANCFLEKPIRLRRLIDTMYSLLPLARLGTPGATA